jgi:hypothetical protein
LCWLRLASCWDTALRKRHRYGGCTATHVLLVMFCVPGFV